MGKKLAIRDFAAKLGLSEKFVQDELKPDVFDFMRDEWDEAPTSVEHDRIKDTILRFIDSEIGHKYFKHNREKNEWQYKCPEYATVNSLSGILKIWVRSKEKTAQRNDHRRQLNNPKSVPSNPWNESNTASEESCRSATPPSHIASPPIRYDRLSKPQRTRLDTVDSEDTNGPLPDIPFRDLEDEEELPSMGELFSKLHEARKKTNNVASEAPALESDQTNEAIVFASTPPPTSSTQSLRTPLRLKATESNNGLISPPTTSRKRLHRETMPWLNDGFVSLEDADVTKKAKVECTPASLTAPSQTNASVNGRHFDNGSRTTQPSASPTAVRVDIPAAPTITRNKHIISSRPSTSSSTTMNATLPNDLTIADPKQPQPVVLHEQIPASPQSLPQPVQQSVVTVLENQQHESINEIASPVRVEQSHQPSAFPVVPRTRTIPIERAHPDYQIKILQEPTPVIEQQQQQPLNSTHQSATAISSPVLTNSSHTHAQLSSLGSQRPQQEPQMRLQTEINHHRAPQQSQTDLFAVIDFLHMYKKSVLLARHCDDPDCAVDKELKDRRRFLRDLEDEAELQIHCLKRD